MRRATDIQRGLTEVKLRDLNRFGELHTARAIVGAPREMSSMQAGGTEMLHYRDGEGRKLHIRRAPREQEDVGVLAAAAIQKINGNQPGELPQKITVTLWKGDDPEAIRKQIQEMVDQDIEIEFLPADPSTVPEFVLERGNSMEFFREQQRGNEKEKGNQKVDPRRSLQFFLEEESDSTSEDGPRPAFLPPLPNAPTLTAKRGEQSSPDILSISTSNQATSTTPPALNVLETASFTDRSGLKHVVTAKAFKSKATGLINTSTGTKEIVKALEVYDQDKERITTRFTSNARAIHQDIHALGEQKLRALEALIAIKKEIEGREKLIETSTQYLETRKGHRKEAEEGTAAHDLEKVNRDIDEITASIQKAEAETLGFRKELDEATENLNVIDSKIADLIGFSEQELDKALRAMIESGETVSKLAKAYLKEKGEEAGKAGKTKTKRFEALHELVAQLEAPGGELLDILSNIQKAPYNNQLARGLRVLNTGTANQVFRVETRGEIGNSGTRVGFAKRAMAEGDIGNDTTEYLNLAPSGEPLRQAPNLIARQVISSRLDQALGLGVLATEVFSVDEAGRPIGISAYAGPTSLPAMEGRGGQTFHRDIPFQHPEIQRNLANLQLIDAITGQRDRHLGNIFIDPVSGRVTGIDNDMAFVAGLDLNRKEHFDNPAVNELYQQFSRGKDGQLHFLPDMIDRKAGEAILQMEDGHFIAILRGEATDPEHLTPDSIKAALERFHAVKTKISQLGKAGQLIEHWNDDTYRQARGQGVIDTKDPNNPNYNNYLARAATELDIARSGKAPGKLLKVEGIN